MKKYKYVELIMSMSVDYLMGKITKETYISNLKTIVEKLGEQEK
jgi:hypothetical protein